MRTFLLLAALMICSITHNVANASIFALGDQYFDSVANHRDIPDGIVTSIAQDSQGFIWIGTQQGAVRFDGYQFVPFKHDATNPNSLAGNYIRTIWNAPDGKIWFGTFSDGISVFNPQLHSFEHFDFSQQGDERNGNSIRAIVGEASHRVWVASNQALNYLNPYSKKIVTIEKINGCEAVYQEQGPRSLLADVTGGLWLGTQNGLCRINLPPSEFAGNTLNGRSFSAFDGIQVHTMIRPSPNHIFVGTLQNGLARFNVNNQQVEWITAEEGQLGHPWVISMLKDDSNQVWVGTLDGGISIVSLNSFSITKQIRHDRSIPNSINQNNIGALFKDRLGHIWIGTWGAGLNLFNPRNDSIRTLRHSPYKNAIKNARIRAITEVDNGDIWVGYSQEGISIIDVQSGQVSHLPSSETDSNGLPNSDILSLLHTQKGEVWIGTRRSGLYRFDPDSNNFQSYPLATDAGLKTITSLVKGQNSVWIGSTRGVWLIRPEDTSPRSISHYTNYAPLEGRITYSLAWQAPNLLWVGTDDGLFAVDTDTESIVQVDANANSEGRLSDNGINSLHVDQNNQLWVATESGLDKLEQWDGKTATFTSITKALNLDASYVANIVQDQQARIWHYKGVYDIPNRHAIDLSNSNEWDIGTIWLGSQEQTREGHILFGGNEGLLLIAPERFQEGFQVPPVVISRAEINNKAVILSPDAPLILAPDNKSFSLEFAALAYTDAKELHYRWQLVGFDDRWQLADADNRRATYTNIPPGEYQLKIQSSNSAGVWMDNEIHLEIISQPSWYETWWFFMLSAALVALLLWWLFVLRTQHLLRQKRNLDLQINQKTKELTQANIDKDRIMSIVAHDINNKISIGLGYLDLLKLSGAKLDQIEWQKYLNQAISAGQGCATLVDELRDYGKLTSESNEIPLKTTNLAKTLDKIIESHRPKALSKKITLATNFEKEVIFCQLHQAKFSRIIENLLSNAIKFSHEEQTVTIEVKVTQNNALISIADEGIGIPEEISSQLFSAFTNVGRKGTQNEKSTGLGLYIVKKLVEQHQGKVWFNSAENQGSVFYVQLPLTD